MLEILRCTGTLQPACFAVMEWWLQFPNWACVGVPTLLICLSSAHSPHLRTGNFQCPSSGNEFLSSLVFIIQLGLLWQNSIDYVDETFIFHSSGGCEVQDQDTDWFGAHRVAQLVGASSCAPKVEGLVPSWDVYRRQLIDVSHIDDSLPLSLKSVFKKHILEQG